MAKKSHFLERTYTMKSDKCYLHPKKCSSIKAISIWLLFANLLKHVHTYIYTSYDNYLSILLSTYILIEIAPKNQSSKLPVHQDVAIIRFVLTRIPHEKKYETFIYFSKTICKL